MNKIVSILIFALIGFVTAVASNKEENLKWSTTSHDFGTIHATGGKVKAEYAFVNNTSESVAIISVTNGGCGCTVPAFTKKPVSPGQKGVITITFDPSRFKGEFKRQVTVTILDGTKRVKTKLKFSGHIIPD